MRLIDADELLNILELGLKTMKCIEKDRYSDFIILESNIEQRENDIEIIKSMPTVEQKHGHWIPRYNDYECSNCLALVEFEDCEGYPMYANYEQFYNNHRYCSVCGAKMDEVTENE